MEFLDSLDYDSVNKKCNRVRSWYLYEQYKSIEENQLDAVLRLKNKSYQDKILKQELIERRARRKLCDEFGLSQSESRLAKSIISRVPSQIPVSDDDLFESFREIHEEYELDNYEDHNSQDSRSYKDIEDDTSVVRPREDCGEKFNSIIENVKDYHLNDRDNIREELETVKQNIAETINIQLDTVKENIECLQKFTKLADDEDIPHVILNNPVTTYAAEHDFSPVHESSLLLVWSQLVEFAYKIINLNHGNCYNNYSSQLFTAVLACDFFLRVINRMCDALQPYVSPIKYASSTNNSEVSLLLNSKEKRKFFVKNQQSIEEFMGDRNKYSKNFENINKKNCLENEWYGPCYSMDYIENNFNEIKFRGMSEPVDSKNINGKKSSRRLSEEFKCGKLFEKDVCECHRFKNILKTILHVTRFIESLIQDIEE